MAWLGVTALVVASWGIGAGNSPILSAHGRVTWGPSSKLQLDGTIKVVDPESDPNGGEVIFPDSGCPPYPDAESEFQRNVPLSGLEELFRRLPAGGSYRGLAVGTTDSSGKTAAQLIHRDIACALAQHSDFSSVFTERRGRKYAGSEKFSGAYEFAAFFGVALHFTNFLTSFEAETPLRECEEDASAPCTRGVSYKARGPFRIKGNKSYASFSSFALGDPKVLLKKPSLLLGQSVGGWVSALWLWTQDQPYGVNCSHWPMEAGRVSPHEALQAWDEVIPSPDLPPLLEAAKTYPNDKASAIAAAKPFGGLGLALSLIFGDGACCPPAVGALRRAQDPSSRKTRQQPVSRHMEDEMQRRLAQREFFLYPLLGSSGADEQDQEERSQLQQQQQDTAPPTRLPTTALPPPRLESQEAKAARWDRLFRGASSFVFLTSGTAVELGGSQESDGAAAPYIIGGQGASGLLLSSPLVSISRVLLPRNGPYPSGDVEEKTGATPLTAARVEGLVLSILAFFLPPRDPSSTSASPAEEEVVVAAAADLALPAAPLIKPPIPLPGDRECIGVFLKEDGETPPKEIEDRMPFRRFCWSLVRGCPALSGAATTEQAALGQQHNLGDIRQQQQRLATETAECVFTCYPADRPVGGEGEEAGATEAMPPQVLLPQEFYIARKGVGCAFFCP